ALRSIRISLLPNVGLKAKSPPWQRRGGCAHKKMSRSHLSGRRRGGSFKRNCFGVWTNHPVLDVSPYRAHASRRAFKGTGIFLDGASTPPLPSLCQGGEFRSPDAIKCV